MQITNCRKAWCTPACIVDSQLSGRQPTSPWTVTLFSRFPNALGGAVVFGSNTIVYLNQAVPPCGIVLNSCYDGFTKFPLKDMKHLKMTLDCSTSVYMEDGRIAVGSREDDLYLLRLVTSSGGATVKSLEFSEVCDTSIAFTLTEILNCWSITKESAKKQRLEQQNPSEIELDEDDIELYGGAIEMQQNDDEEKISESLQFRELDRLLNVGPVKSMCFGRPNYMSNDLIDAKRKDPVFDLVTASGHGKNGALCVNQRSMRPEIITSSLLEGAEQLWAVGRKGNESHKYLIVSRVRSTLILELGEELVELEEQLFVTNKPTVAAGELLQGALAVQLYFVERMGINQAHPVLKSIIDEEVVLYEMFASYNPQPGHLGVAFRKLPHFIGLRTSPYVNIDGKRAPFEMEMEHGKRYTLIHPFERISSINNGVMIGGAVPTLLVYGAWGGMQTHQMTIDGSIKAFTPFNNENVLHGFVYMTQQKSELRIARMHPDFDYDMPYPVKKIEVGKTIHNVRYLMNSDIYAVVSSVPKPSNKIWVVINDDKQEEIHEKDENFVLPAPPKYTLNVTSTCIALVTDGQQMQEVHIDSNFPVVQASIVDPYVALLTQNGRPLLYELAMEPYVHLREVNIMKKIMKKNTVDGRDETPENLAENGHHVAVVTKIKKEIPDDDAMLYGEDDDFLYGDAEEDEPMVAAESGESSTRLQNTRKRKRLGHDAIMSSRGGEQSDAIDPTRTYSSITHWLVVAHDNGRITIHLLPDLELVYQIGRFSNVPELLVDMTVEEEEKEKKAKQTAAQEKETEKKKDDAKNEENQVNSEMKKLCEKVVELPERDDVRYLMNSDIYAVVSSVPKPSNKIWVVINDDKQEEIHEKDENFVLPAPPKYTLNLFSSQDWAAVPNTEFEFEDTEAVTAMEDVPLKSESRYGGLDTYLAIATVNNYGEEVLVRGRIIICEVIEVVPEPGQPTSNRKIKVLYDKEQKGPVTGLCAINGLLLSGMGQKVFIWQFKDNDLMGISFLDMHYYVYQLHSIRTIALALDARESMSLIRFQEENKAMSIASRDDRKCAQAPMASEFLVDGMHIGFLLSDEHGNITLFSYSPEAPESNGGERLTVKAAINIGTNINAFLRLKVTSTCIALVTDGQQMQEVHIDSNFPVVQASIVDPYVALLTQNGQPLLYELAMEPYVHLREVNIMKKIMKKNTVDGRDETPENLAENGHHVAVVTKIKKEIPDDDAMLYGEDDDFLYGDAEEDEPMVAAESGESSTRLQNTRKRKRLGHDAIMSSRGGEQSDAIDPTRTYSSITHWLVVAHDNGRITIHLLPDLELVYQIGRFSNVPELLVDMTVEEEEKEKKAKQTAAQEKETEKKKDDAKNEEDQVNSEMKKLCEKVVETQIVDCLYQLIGAGDMRLQQNEMNFPASKEESRMSQLRAFDTKVSAKILNIERKLLVNEPKEFDLMLTHESYMPVVSAKDRKGPVTVGMWKVDEQATNYKFKFTPTKVGALKVEVSVTDVHTFETQAIPEASVICEVVPIARLLEYNKTAKVGDTVKFTVADAIEGPVEAIIVDPTGKEHRMVILEGSALGEHTFEFTVPTTGIHILRVSDKNIPMIRSPFLFFAHKWKIWGRGIAPEGIRKNDVVGVHVESLDPEENIANSNASLEVVRKDGRVLPISVDYDEVTSTLNFEYQPKEAPEDLEVVVKVGGLVLESHKVHVAPLSSSKLRIYGSGVEGPVYSKEPTRFTIDATQAGPGAVEVALADDHGEKVDLDVLDNQDGSFTVKYTAQRPGAYQLNVVFAGEEISPIAINVKPNVDVSGILVEGLQIQELSLLVKSVKLVNLDPSIEHALSTIRKECVNNCPEAIAEFLELQNMMFQINQPAP
ncbi:unnamed protein product [Caenorhabditis nigoni]